MFFFYYSFNKIINISTTNSNFNITRKYSKYFFFHNINSFYLLKEIPSILPVINTSSSSILDITKLVPIIIYLLSK